ncbi:MAG: chloride channel protein [Eubacteriales bacterium]|nr:chloride channel protein [Eubacteriales bacterium]
MNWKEEMTSLKRNIQYFFKWTVISAVTGVLVGAAGTAFGHGVAWATRTWNTYSWTLYLMPAAGILIVGLYRLFKEEKNRGTDMVLEAISSNEEVTPATAPLIFITTILSHLVSASVGREGAALQLGGSLGSMIGRAIRLDEKDRKIAVMCGMSAGFAALFGTPLAAAVFAMEVISIGVMYYAALVPCVFSAFIGAGISAHFGLKAEHFLIGAVPEFGVFGASLSVLLGILCAGVGVIMCICFHEGGHLYRRYLPNPFLRIAAGSVIFILLTLIFSSRLYNGSGVALIERCFAGEQVPWYSFLIKILFTAAALGAGFKGGEIVPTLTVGAAFGYLLGTALGVPAGLCTAVGMVCLFVSVTNCPVTSVLMAFEMFGFEAMPYYAVSIAVCFTLSGYFGLYGSQKFIYSKTRAEYINRRSH